MAFKSGEQWNGNKNGRPKGSKTRPQLRDYVTKEELKGFIENLKKQAVKDPILLKFLLEQILGKAMQSTEHSFDEEIESIEIIYKTKKDEDKIGGGEEHNEGVSDERTGMEEEGEKTDNQ